MHKSSNPIKREIPRSPWNILKHLSFFFFILLALVLPLGWLSPKPALAEDMNRWRWPSQRVQFLLPASFELRHRSPKGIVAKGQNDVTGKFAPVAEAQTAQEAALAGFKSYRIILRKQILKSKKLTDNGGFNRYILYGRGQSNKSLKKVRFGILGLKNIKTGQSLYVRFWWFARYNKRYNSLTYEIAQSILAY